MISQNNNDEKQHLPLIEAPDEVIAGEPFEVKVSVGSLPYEVEEKHSIDVELYFDENPVGKSTSVVSEGKTEVAFTVVGTEEMIAAREIMNCTIHGFGVCGTCGTKSAIVNLKAVVNCSIHGSRENLKGVEIISATTKSGSKCKWGPEL
ncbi:desulfoferrodoxin family protein [Methanolobus sp. ZRKC2]|uniref:desulfoferrodoxin family protein n=1 Tax=Methanolobus sp. ZRKC2 TaxID=3125783 RepID=UPI003254FEB6